MPGDLNTTIDGFLATLREQVEGVEQQRTELREEYLARDGELKASVSKAKRLIAANQTKPGPKPKTGKPKAVSGTAQDELEAWLREHVDGQDFIMPELYERKDWLGLSSAYGSALMNALHKRGTVRLVKTGHPERGARTKIWRLT